MVQRVVDAERVALGDDDPGQREDGHAAPRTPHLNAGNAAAAAAVGAGVEGLVGVDRGVGVELGRVWMSVRVD